METKAIKQAMPFDLSQPGRLRAADVLAILRISKTSLYDGIKGGRYPKADGKDKRMVFWKTETIKVFLENAAG